MTATTTTTASAATVAANNSNPRTGGTVTETPAKAPVAKATTTRRPAAPKVGTKVGNVVVTGSPAKATTVKKATIDHSKHGHAMTGSEGKKARAACRRAIAAAAKAKAAKK